jgi:hypothetical protein
LLGLPFRCQFGPDRPRKDFNRTEKQSYELKGPVPAGSVGLSKP